MTALHAPLCRALRLPADTPVSGLLALLVAAEPPPAPTEGHGDVILDLVAALPPEMAWLAAELLLRRALAGGSGTPGRSCWTRRCTFGVRGRRLRRCGVWAKRLGFEVELQTRELFAAR